MNKLVLTGLSVCGLLSGTGEAGAAVAPTSGPEECFIVADGTVDATDSDAPDLLTRVVRADSDPATNETDVGTGTGTFNVEGIALQPGTGVLFAADAGRLGTIDLDSGTFSALGDIGEATGEAGRRTIKDVDGLSFDPVTGFLYGTEREARGGDLLIRIDPATGAIVPGALDGADYAVIPGVAGLPDIDDIAVDPVDGRMYAVANDNGRKDHLVVIDKLTGATTDIGVMEQQDVEGLGFASGQLIGTTGKVDDLEGIWDIDKATGAASNRRPLDNARDYEGFDCLNPPGPAVAPPLRPAVNLAPPSMPTVLGATELQPVPVAAQQPVPVPAAARAPAPQAAAVPELPRTGPRQDLILWSGLALAAGGLGVMAGARRRLVSQ